MYGKEGREILLPSKSATGDGLFNHHFFGWKHEGVGHGAVNIVGTLKGTYHLDATIVAR